MKKQFKKIIKSEELRDISIDVVEQVIDNKITDEALSEVPIIKSLVAIRKVYKSYSDAIFVKKAMHVLLELSDIKCEDREKFILDLEEDYESGTEKILMAIDKLDNYNKCKVYGRLCKLKINGKIDRGDFLRLTKIIQDCYLEDLDLITYVEDYKHGFDMEDCFPLVSLGLIFQRNSLENFCDYNGNEIIPQYDFTYLGSLLHEFYENLFPNKKVKSVL